MKYTNNITNYLDEYARNNNVPLCCNTHITKSETSNTKWIIAVEDQQVILDVDENMVIKYISIFNDAPKNIVMNEIFKALQIFKGAKLEIETP